MKYALSILLFLSFVSLNAQFDLYGTIKNEDGELLETASIFLQDSEFATVSDSEGKWILKNVLAGNYALKASFLGYESYNLELEVIDDFEINIILIGNPFQLDKIEINATRVDADAPFAYTNVSKETLQKTNLGQDVPMLLQYTPSAVVTSDAGAGIGYTGIRLRGSDQTHINVTINGVPLNDSESQGVFWVDLPDFASSTESLQIQRGVGTSTNGVGAFGATIGLNTSKIHINPYAQISGTVGSFNTSKYSFQVGTGLMNNKYSVDFRYSKIDSDGYIDRASSDLSSIFFSAARVKNNGVLRFNAFTGSEETYQAWYGSPIEKINGTDEELMTHFLNNYYPGGLYQTPQDSINLFDSGRNYNYYLQDDIVDNYTQNHYQLIQDKQLRDDLNFNGVLHYTRGLGFFEQYRIEDEFEDYGLNPCFDSSTGETFFTSDLRRRRWLDNHFVGTILNLEQQFNQAVLVYGASFNFYRGEHYGQVTWAERDCGIDNDDFYYFNVGKKVDYNGFAKIDYAINESFNLFGDLQYRGIGYKINGDDNDGLDLLVDTTMHFVNPKLGFNYKLNNKTSAYASVAVANREPNRNDFISASVVNENIKHETLVDYEFGIRIGRETLAFEANGYFMDYKNQLVLTGELDDVGSNLRRNIDNSYRLGIELQAHWNPIDKVTWSPNLTLSRNKIEAFNEIIYDYGIGETVVNQFENTDISFSPNVIGGSRLSFKPNQELELEWLSKYVGKQFLDNTSNDSKSLNAYWVNDLRASYDMSFKFAKKAKLNLLVNNIFSHLYSANGYTYQYNISDAMGTQNFTERFVYPQAEINFLLGLEIRFE